IPTRQPPSSAMPSFCVGVEPSKVQLNLVPLYLPATISPPPDQLPSIELKNWRSRSFAEAGASIVAAMAIAAASGRSLEVSARFIERYPGHVSEEQSPLTLTRNG